MTVAEDVNTSLETESTVSETSAAIVSVYNSWSSASESVNFFDDDDTLLLDGVHGTSLPEREPINLEELLQELKKRVREEDLPPTPILRRRRRPACQFLNFMGSRRYGVDDSKPTEPSLLAGLHQPLMVFELPCSQELDLGFEERDALFPLVSSKAKAFYLDDDGRELKKQKLGDSVDEELKASSPFAAEGC